MGAAGLVEALMVITTVVRGWEAILSAVVKMSMPQQVGRWGVGTETNWE